MYKNYKKEVLELLEDKNYIITNTDFDGLLSLAILQKYKPHMQLGGWYNNDNLYMDYVDDVSDYIALDISFTKNMKIDSISNHVEVYGNGISCNSHIGIDNYYDKSIFNTSLFLWASLDSEHLNNMTDEQIKILLSVDSTFLGWFSQGGRFKDKLYNYLKAYDLYRFIEVLENSTEDEYIELQSKYNMKTYSDVKQGSVDVYDLLKYHKWDILIKKLDLIINVPYKKFNFALEGEWRKDNINVYKKVYENELVISEAMIYKGVVVYTTYKQIHILN